MHMKDGEDFVVSKHINTKHAVQGHLFQAPREKAFKDRWFIYQIYDEQCEKAYVGSTVDMYYWTTWT